MRIEAAIFEEVKRLCEAAYPYEGCGVLGGPEGGPVTEAIPVRNAARDEGFDVYRMDPKEQLAAFEELEGKGLERKGFYHSHPDHDAYFSPRDRDSATVDGEPAYPGESYLVLSIGEGCFREAGAFRWSDGGFVEAEVEIV